MGVPAKVYPGEKWLNAHADEIKNIKSMKLPPLKHLNPGVINKHTEKSKAEVYEWMRKPSLRNMYSSPKRLQAHIDADYLGLLGRVYVDEGEKELVYVTKAAVWTFIIDDYIEEVTAEEANATVWELNAIIMWSFPDEPQFRENFVKMLDGGDAAEREAALAYIDRKCDDARCNPGTVYDYSSPETLPLCKAFGELWEEVAIAKSTPRYFLLRWGLTFQLYILSYIIEVRNRNRNAIPTLAGYIDLRRQTDAMEVFMVIIEYLGQAYVPDEVFDTPEMKALLDVAHDGVSMINDIVSFKKEILLGDVHNLVVAISNEQDCSFEEAMKRAWQMALDRIGSIDKIYKDLERVTRPEHKPAIALYGQLARTWATGNNDWSMYTQRYITD